MGWVVTADDAGAGEIIAQESKSQGTRQTAFDAEIKAVEDVLFLFLKAKHRALIIHSDSTSAIARAGHTGVGPGQQHAIRIHESWEPDPPPYCGHRVGEGPLRSPRE
jgi:hypothetical protein